MPVNIINGGSNNNDAAKDAVNSLNEILHDWEEVHDNNGMDPVPHLVKLCDLFEPVSYTHLTLPTILLV